MIILHDILKKLKNEFVNSRKGAERGIWFIYTIVAIIVPFTSSKTSNLLRCLKGLFGFAGIRKKRYYTFMASPKIPWQRLWQCLWEMIPAPLTDDRLPPLQKKWACPAHKERCNGNLFCSQTQGPFRKRTRLSMAKAGDLPALQQPPFMGSWFCRSTF